MRREGRAQGKLLRHSNPFSPPSGFEESPSAPPLCLLALAILPALFLFECGRSSHGRAHPLSTKSSLAGTVTLHMQKPEAGRQHPGQRLQSPRKPTAPSPAPSPDGAVVIPAPDRAAQEMRLSLLHSTLKLLHAQGVNFHGLTD